MYILQSVPPAGASLCNAASILSLPTSLRVATHKALPWLQFVLAPSPARAHFLNAEEKAWLQNRQDMQQKLSAERNPHDGAWWGEHPSRSHLGFRI